MSLDPLYVALFAFGLIVAVCAAFFAGFVYGWKAREGMPS